MFLPIFIAIIICIIYYYRKLQKKRNDRKKRRKLHVVQQSQQKPTYKSNGLYCCQFRCNLRHQSCINGYQTGGIIDNGSTSTHTLQASGIHNVAPIGITRLNVNESIKTYMNEHLQRYIIRK